MSEPANHLPLKANDFSNTIDVYEKVRPNYLPHQVDAVLKTLGIGPNDTVADIGSGTGKLARMFAGKCGEIICVEPSDLREDCRRNLEKLGIKAKYVKGFANQTNLASKSVNLIVAGDAAHWFEPQQEVLKHFNTILKDGGKAAIFVRYPNPKSPLVQRMHALLEDKEHCTCTEYQRPDANKLIDPGPLLTSKKGARIIAAEGSRIIEEPMIMKWTKEDLLDYLKSRSSTKDWAQAHPDEAMAQVVDPVFLSFGTNGTIAFPYKAHVLMGAVKTPEKAASVPRQAVKPHAERRNDNEIGH